MSQAVIFQPAADKAFARAQDEAFNAGVEAVAKLCDVCGAITTSDGGGLHPVIVQTNNATCAQLAVVIRALKRPTTPADEGEAVDAAANKGEG
jgi:hypothetical protein